MRKPQIVFPFVILLSVMFFVTVTAEGYTTLFENGPASNRIDMVFLGDGYTEGEIETVYRSHVAEMLHHMFYEDQDPYPRYKNFFNVHAIDVVSRESGADIPLQGVFRDTALDSSYYFDDTTPHLLFVDAIKANAARREALRDAPFTADVQLVTVNSTRYGGGAQGRYAVFAGGSQTGADVALHEMAHSFHGLADEYGGGGQYDGLEPLRANVTTSPDGAKWAHWIGYEQPGIGTIDVYEGADKYDSGIYRPSPNSKMRTHTQPFDAVSREEIILDIYDFVDPLDTWLDNSTALTNPDGLWVDVVDPEVIQVDWYLDGQLILEDAGERLVPENLNLAPGSYEVSALAYDPTEWVRIEREKLQQLTTWQIVYAPLPQGDFTGDGLLTDADIDLLTNAARELRDEMRFDLNGDELVDQQDREIWVEQLATSAFGDANLDHRVAFDDFVILADGFGREGGWAAGNFDLDTDVGFSDFVLLSANFGYSATAAATVAHVPEPAVLQSILIWICILLIGRLQQRRGVIRAARGPPKPNTVGILPN